MKKILGLKEWRAAKGWRQDEGAKFFGVSHPTYAGWEKGEEVKEYVARGVEEMMGEGGGARPEQAAAKQAEPTEPEAAEPKPTELGELVRERAAEKAKKARQPTASEEPAALARQPEAAKPADETGRAVRQPRAGRPVKAAVLEVIEEEARLPAQRPVAGGFDRHAWVELTRLDRVPPRKGAPILRPGEMKGGRK